MSDPHDTTVEYTVKELLKDLKTEQTAGFTRVETQLEEKASTADIGRLEGAVRSAHKRLDQHGEEIATLKQAASNSAHLSERLKWALGGLGTLGLILATLLGGHVI